MKPLNSSLNWKITSCGAALSFMRQQSNTCEKTSVINLKWRSSLYKQQIKCTYLFTDWSRWSLQSFWALESSLSRKPWRTRFPTRPNVPLWKHGNIRRQEIINHQDRIHLLTAGYQMPLQSWLSKCLIPQKTWGCRLFRNIKQRQFGLILYVLYEQSVM